MLWDDKVKNWLQNEVTLAFFAELKADECQLLDTLRDTDNLHTILRVQGMLRAIKGVIALPETDGIPDPKGVE